MKAPVVAEMTFPVFVLVGKAFSLFIVLACLSAVSCGRDQTSTPVG